MDCKFEIDCPSQTQDQLVELLDALETSDSAPSIEYGSATVIESPALALYIAEITYSGEVEFSDLKQRHNGVVLYSTTRGDVTLTAVSDDQLTVELYNRS